MTINIPHSYPFPSQSHVSGFSQERRHICVSPQPPHGRQLISGLKPQLRLAASNAFIVAGSLRKQFITSNTQFPTLFANKPVESPNVRGLWSAYA